MASVIVPQSNSINLLTTGNTVANAIWCFVSANVATTTTLIVANSSGVNLYSVLLPSLATVKIRKQPTDLLLVSVNNTASATKIASTY